MHARGHRGVCIASMSVLDHLMPNMALWCQAWRNCQYCGDTPAGARVCVLGMSQYLDRHTGEVRPYRCVG